MEEKIRYLLRKFPSTEWSGVLFYTYEGTFENNDLVITCQDIFPMDLGNATFTEFSMTEDVAAYLADNIELFDSEMGLIHSHHNMSAFFSGTDTDTLQEEGDERNCFVSLIVNNAGTYCAAITRKMQSKSEVNIRRIEQSYEFFGSGKVDAQPASDETIKTVDTEVIEYFMLDVERHEVDNPMAYLDKRFAEIKEKKEAIKKPVSYIPQFGNDFDYDYGILDYRKPEESYYNDIKVPVKKEPTLWDNSPSYEISTLIDYTPDADLIYSAVCKMITLSLNLNTEKFSLKQWVTKYIDKVYKKVFSDDFNDGYTSFDQWVDFIVEFMVTGFKDPKMPINLEAGLTEMSVAAAMLDLLQDLRKNMYIESYCKALERYIELE